MVFWNVFLDKDPCHQSYGFSSSHIQMWELDHEEGWASRNLCFQIVVLEKTLKSSLDFKEFKPVNPKENQPWMSIGGTDVEAEVLATWCEGLTHWKRPWCWERLQAEGEGGGRGWEGQIASPTQRTWILANSRISWRTGRPGMLQAMESKRAGHDLVTEQQQITVLKNLSKTGVEENFFKIIKSLYQNHLQKSSYLMEKCWKNSF